MTEQIRIGFDVGGTFTDGVLMKGKQVISKTKSLTTEDITTGIINALDTLLEQSKVDHSKIEMVSLGTTHTTNAIIERRNLDRVGVFRIGAPATTAIPPMTGWPEDLIAALGGKEHVHIIRGGSEYNGKDIVPLDEKAIMDAAKAMKGKVGSVAITGVFSPIISKHEDRALEIVREYLGEEVFITQSHKIASISLLERENSTILNASVKSIMKRAVEAFKSAVADRNINAKLFVVQNDGSVMNADHAVEYPIFTVASGPAASVRGAVYLSGIENGAVVDVGGTSTDVAYIVNGFPRESSITVNIGGVKTNVRCPDLLSIALGGGTIIKSLQDNVTGLGPESVGYNLVKLGKSFGGPILTVHDIAVATGRLSSKLDIFDTNYVTHPGVIENLSSALVKEANARIKERVEIAIDQMKTESGLIPAIFIGGGALAVPQQDIEGTTEVILPNHFEVGGAIGTTIAEIGASAEMAVDLAVENRNEAIDRVVAQAKMNVQNAGAIAGTEEIIDVEEIPFAYMPGKKQKVRVRVKGKVFS
ncbi:hydantoinase/oxoprolinase family protein [Cytobacillus oceanisediminis]|uniref:hydantoinase/oxoprolinase family protein n=1 Tax=Cytobacillus oceanisediminis TaxID=665099 RepID=UPI001D13B6F7|nr:hydantoinase/oxoprolinase family protein [Cytobacillus oceanisediminis]MCC3646788.1 hydantoinase/oxoprolinase family protein [Cytobacillus oceanisediminis]